jgi:hypothetical protein
MMHDEPEVPQAALPRVLQRGAEMLLRSGCNILPRSRHSWGEAVAAEARALADAPGGWRFALSAAFALFTIAVRDAVHGRVADLRLVMTAGSIGMVAAVMDLSIGSRIPMILIVGTASFVLAARAPWAAWRWPLLIGGMLPLIILLTGHPGPYAYDGGDQWYCGVISAMCTGLGAAASRLLNLGHGLRS